MAQRSETTRFHSSFNCPACDPCGLLHTAQCRNGASSRPHAMSRGQHNTVSHGSASCASLVTADELLEAPSASGPNGASRFGPVSLCPLFDLLSAYVATPPTRIPLPTRRTGFHDSNSDTVHLKAWASSGCRPDITGVSHCQATRIQATSGHVTVLTMTKPRHPPLE